MRKPKIWDDELYIHCISLARLSKGNERFGSLLVKDGEIIGQGFNRAVVHKQAGINLPRIIRQGYANHAEIESLNQSLENGHDVSGADIHCAGYFPETGQLFFHDNYTCVRCPPHMQEYGIKNIVIPKFTQWNYRPMEVAIEEAKRFTNGTQGKRRGSVLGNYNISDIEHLLLDRDQLNID